MLPPLLRRRAPVRRARVADDVGRALGGMLAALVLLWLGWLILH